MADELDLVLAALADESRPVQRKSLLNLSNPTREAEERFMACFSQLSAARRREVKAAMVAYAEEKFDIDYMHLFRRCLTDSDAEVRCSAIEGLWEDERLDLVRPLLRLLASDPSVQVRAAAAASLGRFVFLGECDELPKHYGEAIRNSLEAVVANTAEDIEVVRRAIESLAYINDSRIRELIDRAYEHSDPRMKQSALFAMGRSADRFWAEIVLEELRSPFPAMRYEASRACGEMELRRAVEPLIALTDDPDREVQVIAIWALGQGGGKRAKRALERLLLSEDEAVVAAADEALEYLSFGSESFDLLVHELDAEQEDFIVVGPEDALDEEIADATVDDTDWPDEFLDIDS